MNAVEIEEAVSTLAAQPFDAAEFPFLFLAAFDNKETAIKRLRSGNANPSDLPNCVLQRNHIHIGTCAEGDVGKMLNALRESPKTAACKVEFILATDGIVLEAENLNSRESIVSSYAKFPEHFGFFLSLAGISTVAEVTNNPVDIKATGRLNRLYLELLKNNPEWGKKERRSEMNHFIARLIFCFFAEDTGIFQQDDGLFTKTVEQMSLPDGSNTAQVIAEIFRAMNIAVRDGGRDQAVPRLPSWAHAFPYVNGGLFSGSTEVPGFSRIARSYFLKAGELNWREINPDIFGSMIQAVADDAERGALGMHYTSAPNILKVLNPLFLNDLRSQLEAAGENTGKLKKLRTRMSKIRVFDPACGSGNFLVIAYKQMREIENRINQRLGEPSCKSLIPKTNFRGIELRDFPAEIARLALIIAEFQCDEIYRDRGLALAEFLPLDRQNWITCGNALRLDWFAICPPTGNSVRLVANDLFATPLDQLEIDFENEGGETFICGNPPYLGSQWQADEQKTDLRIIFDGRIKNWKSLDYVSGWFMKAVDYGRQTNSTAAFVATNSICQGRQVQTLWSEIFSAGYEIVFAHTSFKWTNLASHNAGVTVVIVGISNHPDVRRRLFSIADDDKVIVKDVSCINAYLAPFENIIVVARSTPLSEVSEVSFGNMPNDGGHLLLSFSEAVSAVNEHGVAPEFIRAFVGSQEFIRGVEKRCIWVTPERYPIARQNTWLAARFDAVCLKRDASDRKTTNKLKSTPFRFGEVRQTGHENVIIVPRVSSESRYYLPVGYAPGGTIVSDAAFVLYDAPLWNMALIASRLHLVWVATVCGKLKTDFRYSNTLGWNTFPVPALTDQERRDLTRCAEDILAAREVHFPKTVADLYNPDTMPENLRHAHERNDEVLEQIYIGRRFRNDTERLEKLFGLYTEMVAAETDASGDIPADEQVLTAELLSGMTESEMDL